MLPLLCSLKFPSSRCVQPLTLLSVVRIDIVNDQLFLLRNLGRGCYVSGKQNSLKATIRPHSQGDSWPWGHLALNDEIAALGRPQRGTAQLEGASQYRVNTQFCGGDAGTGKATWCAVSSLERRRPAPRGHAVPASVRAALPAVLVGRCPGCLLQQSK